MPRTDEGETRERERKEAYNARKWREQLLADVAPKRGAVVQTELAIADIDQSPAVAVRAELNQEAVEAYAEVDNLPPVEVFEGGGKYFLGDGRHRIAAKIHGNRKKIQCRVTRCKTADDALTLARLHAFGANATHGLPRTATDKRVAVKACLSIPEYSEQSDRRVAEICRVGKWLVGQVRDELAGAAKPAPRTVKAPTKPRDTDPPSEPAKGGRATTPDAGVGRGEEDGDDDPPPIAPAVAAPIPKPAVDAILDMRGRVVPAPLVPLFRFGRAYVADLRSTLSEVAESVKTAGEEHWGKGLLSLLPTVESDLKKIAQDVGSAVPFCCCPHINADGVHPFGGKCKVCVDGRGWLSRHNWHQLSDPVKKLIDELATDKPQEAP